MEYRKNALLRALVPSGGRGSLPQPAQRKLIFLLHAVRMQLNHYHFPYEPDAASYPPPEYETAVILWPSGLQYHAIGTHLLYYSVTTRNTTL
jgi:hypothetical protein